MSRKKGKCDKKRVLDFYETLEIIQVVLLPNWNPVIMKKYIVSRRFAHNYLRLLPKHSTNLSIEAEAKFFQPKGDNGTR